MESLDYAIIYFLPFSAGGRLCIVRYFASPSVLFYCSSLQTR